MVGMDKVLFGSDFLLIKPARYFDEMKKTGLSGAKGVQIMQS